MNGILTGRLSGTVKHIFHYLLVILIIGLTTLVCLPLSSPQSYHIVSFILLFVVAILAVFLGIGPVLLASTMSAVSWNYFFIPPFHTFHIANTEDRLMFVSFFIIALLNGILTNRIRRQERAVRDRENQTNALFRLTAGLSGVRGTDEVIRVAEEHFRTNSGAGARFIIQDGNNTLVCQPAAESGEDDDQPDHDLVKWVFANQKSLETGREPFILSDRGNDKSRCCVCRIAEERYRNKDAFWDTCCSLIAGAIEREFLGEMATRARVLDESDRFYGTLFNLVSHEFRIPIAAIMGASDTLMSSEASEENRKELYGEILKASARLNHMTENLLNMSRIESGRISLRLDWHDVTDLFQRVTLSLKQELAQFHVIMSIPEDMPLVRIDFSLVELILNNLLLNATQHSPPGSAIKTEASYENKGLVIRVSDSVPGFPPASLPALRQILPR